MTVILIEINTIKENSYFLNVKKIDFTTAMKSFERLTFQTGSKLDTSIHIVLIFSDIRNERNMEPQDSKMPVESENVLLDLVPNK